MPRGAITKRRPGRRPSARRVQRAIRRGRPARSQRPEATSGATSGPILPVIQFTAPALTPPPSAPVNTPTPTVQPDQTLDGGLGGLPGQQTLEGIGMDALPILPQVQELDLSVSPSEDHFGSLEGTTPTRGLPTPPHGLNVPHLEAMRGEENPGVSSIHEEITPVNTAGVSAGSSKGSLPPPPAGLEIPVNPAHNRTTPTIEPFPGLNPDAVPYLDIGDLVKANVKLTSEEMFMLSRIDGSMSMEELEALNIDASPLRQLALMKRLWRAGFLTFK